MNIDHPITILTANLGHLPEMIRLERQSPTAAHWSEVQYRLLFQSEKDRNVRLALVAERDRPGERRDGTPEVVGFLIAHHLSPDWELENILVALEARSHGIGTRLMEQFLARAQETNSQAVFLEVRESNTLAKRFYEKLGFHQTGRRKSYYSNPVEDAVLYCKTCGQAPISS